MQKLKKQYCITGITISLCVIIFIPLVSFLCKASAGEILRNGITALMYSMGLGYYFGYCYFAHKFDYDNFEHPYRFLSAYLFAFALCLLFTIVDAGGWIFLSLGITVALFSNSLLGLYVTSGFIMFSCMLHGEADIITFFVYFITVFLGIILFQDVDQEFDGIHAILISVVIAFVAEFTGFVLLKNEKLSAEQFIIPIVNCVINFIVIFWVLKYFNDQIANKYRNKYLELNDQEYKALVEFKKEAPKDYWCSIHTAYLVDRISYSIGCNVNMSKSLSYYHRFKKALSFTGSASEKFITDNGFPPETADALLSYWSKRNLYKTREECIVFISDNMISTLQSIFAKDKNAKVDYDDLYENLMAKDFMKKALSDSDLSIKDLKIIKEIILKEKLYYDFLR